MERGLQGEQRKRQTTITHLNRYLPMNRIFYLSILCMSMLLASCGKEEYSQDSDTSYTFTYPSDNSKGYVMVLQQHTKGNGFPVVIMADGYLQSDIAQGTYHTSVNKAIEALFASEPMKSLKAYFDIYEVQAASSVSGITTAARNTAFSTYFTSESGVEIDGDKKKIEKYAWYALKKDDNKFKNALVIMLVNSDRYGGVTFLSTDNAVTDSIPVGFSLAFVPTGCKSKGVSYFTETLQHEAVGHGIGKLADEYFENFEAPSQDLIDKYKKLQGYGMYLNTKYDTSTENDGIYGWVNKTTNNTTYLLCYHQMQPDDIGYIFANDPGYQGEDMTWIQGGYTYLTFTTTLYSGSDSRYKGYYMTDKNFYRPSWHSLMNSVTTEDGKTFNALSRYLIYARIMKVANGSPGNIHNQQLKQRFMEFDTMRGNSTAAKAAIRTTQSAREVDAIQSLPPLPAPRIIEDER